MTGADTAGALHAFADHFAGRTATRARQGG
jgi:hypothetical protein